MRPQISLREALDDRALLGAALEGDSWRAWRVLLIAAMGEALLPDELPIFERLTGRTTPPATRVDEFIAIIGRRGGKDRAASVLAAYLAGLCDHKDGLAAGETPTLLCIGPDQRQSAITLNYIEGVFETSEILSHLVETRSNDSLVLSNGVVVEVRAGSFRRIRGVTAIGVIATEAAFWMSDDSSQNPDVEILNAARPALATTKGPLVVISSPYAKQGQLWDSYRQNFGPNGDPSILVAKGASRDLNPTLDQKLVDRAIARDPEAGAAEWLGQFRSDIASFISREVVEGCIDKGVKERGPSRSHRYFSFTDPSGGSADSMTAAVGHWEGDTLIVDAVREIPAPFNPEDAVTEIATFFAAYGVTRTKGDRYSGQWCPTSFERHRIQYISSDLSKSGCYLELLPRLNAKSIRLVDNERLINQICSLERRTTRGGRDSIDHPPRMHDDLANCVAGLIADATAKSKGEVSTSLFKGHY